AQIDWDALAARLSDEQVKSTIKQINLSTLDDDTRARKLIGYLQQIGVLDVRPFAGEQMVDLEISNLGPLVKFLERGGLDVGPSLNGTPVGSPGPDDEVVKWRVRKSGV